MHNHSSWNTLELGQVSPLQSCHGHCCLSHQRLQAASLSHLSDFVVEISTLLFGQLADVNSSQMNCTVTREQCVSVYMKQCRPHL